MTEPVTHAGTEVPHDASGPSSFYGVTPTMFVALALITVYAILIWKKVPAAIGRALDSRIASIRGELDEAAALRREAEALKLEYQAKAKVAEAEAAEIIERAQSEVEAILAKSKADTEALIERRVRLAEEKIAAEERDAIAQLRVAAADAAIQAATRLIADRNDAANDTKLIDHAIAALGNGAGDLPRR